uniref:Uncharacterized protein n=1 Tax=Arundo donax TaxID=35708 RepID=A0A0A9DRW0_ARUDO
MHGYTGCAYTEPNRHDPYYCACTTLSFILCNQTYKFEVNLFINSSKMYLQDSLVICPGSQSSIEVQSCRTFNEFLNK